METLTPTVAPGGECQNWKWRKWSKPRPLWPQDQDDGNGHSPGNCGPRNEDDGNGQKPGHCGPRTGRECHNRK